MWYVIVAGAGLVLGIGLLIWGLRERSARNNAEKETYDLQQKLAWTEAASDTWKQQCDAQREALLAAEAWSEQQKVTIADLQERLIKSKDPQAIKDWLDEELSEEKI